MDISSDSTEPFTLMHPLYRRIVEALDLVPNLLISQLEKCSEVEHEQQNARINHLRNEIVNLNREYDQKKVLAFQSSCIRALETDIQKVSDDIRQAEQENEVDQAMIVRLSDECMRWPDEQQRLEEGIQLLRMPIEAIQTTRATKNDAVKQPEALPATPHTNPKSLEDEYIDRIKSLRSAIRATQTQLDRSRVNPELTERIRLIHVCRGVIETSPRLSPETRSKLLTLLNS